MVTSREQGERKLKTVHDTLRTATHQLNITKEQLAHVKRDLQASKEVVSEFKLSVQVMRF